MKWTRDDFAYLLNDAVRARTQEALAMFGRVVAGHHSEPQLVMDALDAIRPLVEWNDTKCNALAEEMLKLEEKRNA